MSTESGESKEKTLIEKVVGDSNRISYEKETIFRFNRQEKVVHVSTFDPTIVKGLLHHELFEADDYSKNENGKVIGVSGHLPRGTLKIKKKSRKRDYPSTIISSEDTKK